MQALKQEAIDTISKLPDDANMEEIMYRLYVLDKVQKGQEAIKQGKTISSDELQREIDTWQFGLNRRKQIYVRFMILLRSTPLITPKK